jgi:sodium transport system permease protein
MSRASRVKSIYVKELIETVRDRRTLLAMLFLPMLLYPLMVLGFAKIRTLENTALQDSIYRVAVPDVASGNLLSRLIEDYRQSLPSAEPSSTEQATMAGTFQSAPDFRVVIQHVRDADVGILFDAAVEFTRMSRLAPASIEDLNADHLEARIIFRQTDVRSDAAASYLKSVFDWQFGVRRDRAIDVIQKTLRRDYPEADIYAALSPVTVEQRSISSAQELGGWLFGQILPIILVVMTVSGATYPAIDLTAGERERGTLETLLVAPVPISELITGKFLVVTTIAIVTAILNVICMGATLQFGGVSSAFGGPGAGPIPLIVFPIMLLCLLPFAVFSSAVTLAVCSFARTFKEAQNYVMPVLIACMVPAAVGLMQTVELEGVVMVTPVANLTLFTRDLFQGTWTWTGAVVVWLSTALYAAAAVAVATKLFSQEEVIFADSAPLKTLLTRRWLLPKNLPTPSQVLLPVAILFPLLFYLQTALQQRFGGDLVRFIHTWGVVQVFLFVGMPGLVIWYLKLDLRRTLSLRPPRLLVWPAVILIGATSWIVATEIGVFQLKYFGRGLQLTDMEATLRGLFSDLGLWQALLFVAVLTGVCEEVLFRGFLLAGVRRAAGKWGTILVVGMVFGLFHLYGFKLLVTCLLGMLLAWLCWQTRSIWPAILVHIMHNAAAVILVSVPQVARTLRFDTAGTSDHLPFHIIIPGFVLFAAALACIARIKPASAEPLTPQSATT